MQSEILKYFQNKKILKCLSLKYLIRLTNSTSFLRILKNLNCHFLSKSKKKDLDQMTIKINQFQLSLVQDLDYLVFVLDKFLSWDAHVNYLYKKIAQNNHIMSKLRHYVPQKTCISICFSLCCNHLYYTAPQRSNLHQRPFLIQSSFCRRNVYT